MIALEKYLTDLKFVSDLVKEINGQLPKDFITKEVSYYEHEDEDEDDLIVSKIEAQGKIVYWTITVQPLIDAANDKCYDCTVVDTLSQLCYVAVAADNSEAYKVYIAEDDNTIDFYSVGQRTARHITKLMYNIIS